MSWAFRLRSSAWPKNGVLSKPRATEAQSSGGKRGAYDMFYAVSSCPIAIFDKTGSTFSSMRASYTISIRRGSPADSCAMAIKAYVSANSPRRCHGACLSTNALSSIRLSSSHLISKAVYSERRRVAAAWAM